MTRTLPDQVAGAMADGEPIAWDDAFRLAGDQNERQVLSDLRTLQTMVDSLRQDSPTATFSPASSMPWLATTLAGLACWWVAIGFLGAVVGSAPSTRFLPFQVGIVVSLALAAAILYRGGRKDVRARWLGLLYLILAAAFAHPLESRGAFLWPASPGTYGLHAEAFAPFAAWRFASMFPFTARFSRADRTAHVGALVAFIAGSALFVINVALALGGLSGDGALSWLARDHRMERYWDVLYLLLLPAIAVSLIRALVAPPDERRRVRLFGAAFALSLAPLLLKGLGEQVSPAFSSWLASSSRARVTADTVVFAGLLSLPLLTLYAIVTRRALPLTTLITRAMQLALARHAATSVSLLCWCALAWWLSGRTDLPLSVLMTSGFGQALVAVATGTGLLAVFNRQLTNAVERLFRHRHVDQHVQVALCARALHHATTATGIAAILADTVRDVWNAQWCALMKVTSHSVTTVYGSVPPLNADSCLLLIARDTMAVSLPRLTHLLPAAERRWVEVTGTEVVVAVTNDEHGCDALIAIGPKHDGLPWSHEDMLSLTTVAHAASLAMQKTRFQLESPRTPEEEFAAECLYCGLVAPTLTARCACGGEWQPAALPSVLNRKFAVERLVGRGGMGLVYRGLDIALARPVALKTLPRVDPSAMAHLAEEARAMAQVTHPNLALVFGLERWQRTPVLVLEYLDGGTLLDRLRHGAMPPEDALDMALSVAAALGSLHAAGVVHGDVKPSNIGFGRGQWKLLDFGLSRLVPVPAASNVTRAPTEEEDTASVWGGTTPYMSPELVRGVAPSPHSDLWALSIVLLEACGGRNPFLAATHREILLKVATTRVRAHNCHAPRQLASLLDILLHPDIKERPANAAEFYSRLIAVPRIRANR